MAKIIQFPTKEAKANEAAGDTAARQKAHGRRGIEFVNIVAIWERLEAEREFISNDPEPQDENVNPAENAEMRQAKEPGRLHEEGGNPTDATQKQSSFE